MSTADAAAVSVRSASLRGVASVGVEADDPVLPHAVWPRLLPQEGFVAERSMVVLGTVGCADAAELVTNLMH